MKKILSGILGLALTLTVVGGVAYAAFSTQASVLGTEFSTGTPSLQLWNGSGYVSEWSPGWIFSGLYPGYITSPTDFYLYNNGNTGLMNITGHLRNGVSGDWASFSDNVKVGISIYPTAITDPTSTDWHTLGEWNSNNYTLGAIAQGAQVHYNFNVMVPSGAGNELIGKTLSGVNFDFTGTTP